MWVKNVTSSDYGAYDCIAQNEMGIERYSIYLNVTSGPDPPSYPRILNVTYNSVNLTWTPGFNGGFDETFKIRYRRDGAENFQYVDVAPKGTSTYEIEDLKVDTKYSISIMAFNAVGASAYTPPFIIGTKSETTSSFVLFTILYQQLRNFMRSPESWSVSCTLS
jgi:hypothetical protein